MKIGKKSGIYIKGYIVSKKWIMLSDDMKTYSYYSIYRDRLMNTFGNMR